MPKIDEIIETPQGIELFLDDNVSVVLEAKHIKQILNILADNISKPYPE
jgi:hypothetical protein